MNHKVTVIHYYEAISLKIFFIIDSHNGIYKVHL